MINKIKVYLVLIMAVVAFKANAQTKSITTDDSLRIPKGPSSIQQMPAFPGKPSAYYLFVRSNIRYPSAALNKKVEGMAFVQFIVEKDGTLSNIKLVRDPGEGLGQEAVRVIASSPKWLPGKDNDVAVRVQMVVQVNFVLPKTPPSN